MATIMIPLQSRANQAQASGNAVSTGPLIALICILSLACTAILGLMLLKPQ